MNIKRKQNGFSLVELMVGLVIGLIVSGIVITTFVQSKRSYTQDETIARLQENARFALQLLTTEISMAGFAGNMQLAEPVGVLATSKYAGGKAAVCGINWWEISKNPVTVLADSSSLDCISGEKSGTNIVIFRRVEGKSTTSPTIGELYFRSNGRGGDILVHDGSPIPADNTYWPYIVRAYYLKVKPLEGKPGEPTTGLPDGLYRSSLTYDTSTSALKMTPEGNLVPGFFGFGSVAGLDTDDDGVADKYVSSVTSLSGMVGLKIDILMSSETDDPTYTNEKTYFLGLKPENTDLLDSYYYGRVFSTTVPLRNTAFRNQMSTIK